MKIDFFSEEKAREATRTCTGKKQKEYSKALVVKDASQSLLI